MNKETYEALKRIILLAKLELMGIKEQEAEKDIKQLEDWIDEVRII